MHRDVLFNRQTESVIQNGIRSYGHQLYTESVTKTALSFKDDKVLFVMIVSKLIILDIIRLKI